MTYYQDSWIKSKSDNWCLKLGGTLVATVFTKKNSEWYGAVINCPDSGDAFFFPGNIESVKNGQSLVETAWDNSSYTRLPWRKAQYGWQRSKKAGNLYLKAEGCVYSLRKATSGSYYVVTQDGRWTCPITGCEWFRDEIEAQLTVDQAIADSETNSGIDVFDLEFDLDFDD